MKSLSQYFPLIPVFSFTFLMSTTGVVQASNSTVSPDWTEQRETYSSLIKQTFEFGSSEYQNALTKLDDYPLQPYFVRNQLRKNLTLDNEVHVAAFLDEHQHTPLDWSLRRAWLKYLAKKGEGKKYVQYFRPTSDATLSCHYYRFQLQLGVDTKNVLSNVEPLWLKGRSQPKECDPLFKVWEQQGYRTDKLLWQRILLAEDAAQSQLSAYLQRQLSDEQQYLKQVFNMVKRNPGAIADMAKLPERNEQEGDIIVYALTRMAWDDEVKAMELFKRADEQQRLNEHQRKLILNPLVTALARSDSQDAGIWYANLDRQYIHDGALQWRIAYLLRSQNYQGIIDELELLTPETQAKNQWQYWRARSLQELERDREATIIYRELARKRSYYGFLAAVRLGNSSQINHQPLNIDDNEKLELLLDKSGQRALELFHLEQYILARREWYYWMRDLDEKQKLIAARIAYEQGWYDRSIYSLSQLGSLNDIEIRFPMPFASVFEQAAQQYEVDESWAYAIARKESLFMSDAASHAGAFGLMQVRPMTANFLRRPATSFNRWQLMDVDTNVDIGFNYLNYLMQRFDQNLLLATAAYNAGPEKVVRWLEDNQSLPADVWVESIPYRETRNYVKSVLAYTEIYRHRQEKSNNAFQQLILQTIE
ncbi:transglycosylase SLT domain-containing protein [Thalassotalea mangrovi]|nr:transglycosylase SLT domain-containing protein [Thalassotalea mangrovi]